MVDMPFVRGEYCEGWGDVVDVALSDRRGTTSREVIERGKGMELSSPGLIVFGGWRIFWPQNFTL